MVPPNLIPWIVFWAEVIISSSKWLRQTVKVIEKVKSKNLIIFKVQILFFFLLFYSNTLIH